MKVAYCVLGALLVVVAACGGTDAPACTFNSDCAAGRYCTASGTCTADCTTDSECVTTLGDGATCSSFGMCIARPDGGPQVDAGDQDASTPTDAGPRDGGPVDLGVDAGPPPEVCTPSTLGSVAADEDGDGLIDEGCSWHFGRPQPLTRQHVANGSHFAPQLSADGQRLYFVSYTAALGNQIFVAERASRAVEFGVPTRVAGTDFDRFVFGGVTLSADELEMFVQATDTVGGNQGIYRTVRTARAASFGAMTLIVGASTANEVHPFISRDGRELYYVTNLTVPAYALRRLVRASPSDAFGAPEDVSFPSVIDGMMSPSLTQDGQTLFFGSAARLFRAERVSPGGATFGAPVEVAELTAGGALFFFVSDDGREAFFNSSRDWSPTGNAMWRVQVCRDGPCDEPLIDCATGVRSPDGLHCYFAGPAATGTNDEALIGCASRGAHLPTVHSEAERALLWSTFGAGGSVWLGGTDVVEGTWRWDWLGRVVAEDPEEPFLFAPWGAGEPNGGGTQNCLLLYASPASSPGLFNDGVCATSYGYACEDDTWPTW